MTGLHIYTVLFNWGLFSNKFALGSFDTHWAHSRRCNLTPLRLFLSSLSTLLVSGEDCSSFIFLMIFQFVFLSLLSASSFRSEIPPVCLFFANSALSKKSRWSWSPLMLIVTTEGTIHFMTSLIYSDIPQYLIIFNFSLYMYFPRAAGERMIYRPNRCRVRT